MTVFSGRQNLTSARKVMVDFKFDVSLHRESTEVGLVEKVSGSLYWWVEMGAIPKIESATALSDIYILYTVCIYTCIYMDSNTDRFTPLALCMRGNYF